MELKELLKDHLPAHSEFQQDYFITGSSGTLYGQYKQALREIYCRIRILRDLYFDQEKLQVEIAEQKRLKLSLNKFKRKYADIEYRRKLTRTDDIERDIASAEKEFKRFYAQALLLKGKIGEITPEKQYNYEKEMFTHHAMTMVANDYMSSGRISNASHEMLQALPLNTRKEIYTQIKSKDGQDKLVNDILLIDKEYISEIQVENIDIRKLIGG